MLTRIIFLAAALRPDWGEHIELSLLSDEWGECGASNTGVIELC